jgi:hypothetical protein
MADYTEYTKFKGQSTLGNPFTYVATGRFPIVGASVFPTYNDMIAFIESSTSTAYGGAILYVISDKETSKNGAYEIRFKNLTPDSNGALQYFINGVSNLEAIKLVNVNEQGGIESGNIIYGFYREGTTFIEERTVNGEKKYYNGDTEVTNVTDDEKNSVLPYIVLNLTNGDKIFINAEAFQAVSDTFVNAGSYDKESKNLTLTKNDGTEIEINLSEISVELEGETAITDGNSEFVAVEVSKTENGINKLSSTLKIQTIADATIDTNGLVTAKDVKDYVDVYDCGTFELEL